MSKWITFEDEHGSQNWDTHRKFDGKPIYARITKEKKGYRCYILENPLSKNAFRVHKISGLFNSLPVAKEVIEGWFRFWFNH